jgi:hypothetical protein
LRHRGRWLTNAEPDGRPSSFRSSTANAARGWARAASVLAGSPLLQAATGMKQSNSAAVFVDAFIAKVRAV